MEVVCRLARVGPLRETTAMAWDGRPEGLVPIEPVLVSDCFVTGVTSVVYIGGLVRVTLHCDRPTENGEIERIIVCRLVMTEADYTIANAIGAEAVRTRRSFPHKEEVSRTSH